MTEEQERVLVNTVERLTVAVQLLASRLQYETGREGEEARRVCAEENVKLCDAFPWLRE